MSSDGGRKSDRIGDLNDKGPCGPLRVPENAAPKPYSFHQVRVDLFFCLYEAHPGSTFHYIDAKSSEVSARCSWTQLFKQNMILDEYNKNVNHDNEHKTRENH